MPDRFHEAFSSLLEEPDGIVHAGQLSLDRVVPWGLLYLRPFDDASSVPAAACSAPIEPRPCGTHPECPLHPNNAARAGQTEATTACPRYFLGFRHQIEVPPQQVEILGDTTELAPSSWPATPRSIPCTGNVRILVDYNRGLSLARQHTLELVSKITPADFAPRPLFVRDDLMSALQTGGASIVYVYCHAIDSLQLARGTVGAHLIIEDTSSKAGRIFPANIKAIGELTGKPLVFLNGCQTVGFSPFAPAEFIERFVERGASAVIGTEATVWEALAVEMAETFLTAFVNERKCAGQALLEARRSLLRKKNPLGLAYTLYGSADLALDVCDSTSITNI